MTTHPRARHLAIGLDGADLSLIEHLGPRVLPNLHALMRRGAYAALRSVQPPATLPNWTTFLTGADPGTHGVFDFTTRTGYRVRFTAGSVREQATIAKRLDQLGKACACLFFPATFPPEHLRHGAFISGWDAPVAFDADPSFVSPRALHAEISERFGPMRFADVDEFHTDAPEFFARLPEVLGHRIRKRTDLCQWLLRKRTWDLFAVYFGESDTAAHHLWALHDRRSPRHPQDGQHATDGLTRVYRELDAAVGRLVACAGGRQVEVTIASDHGFGGSSDKVLYLNRALADAGLLQFRASSPVGALAGHAKELALTALPPKIRQQLFRIADTRLPSLLESHARFGAIDMTRTRAFSDELNYFPAVHLNVAGRDPRGTVAPSDIPPVKRAVERALLSLRDPWTGKPVVARVTAREDMFRGPFVERAPDLLLELELDDGYSYNLMPSAGAPKGTGAFRKLAKEEYLGRKGRSLQGSHRAHGLWIAAGPQVAPVGRVGAHIADATATLLTRMGVGLDTSAAGHVPTGVLQPGGAPVTATLPAPDPTGSDEGREQQDEARVAARLRRLGYIE